MERLKKEDMDGETDSEKVRSIQAVIPSSPVAVPHFTFLSSASVSGIVQSQENKSSSREDSLGIGEDFTVDGTNVELKQAEKYSLSRFVLSWMLVTATVPYESVPDVRDLRGFTDLMTDQKDLLVVPD